MKFIGLKPQGINEIGSSVQVTGSLSITGDLITPFAPLKVTGSNNIISINPQAAQSVDFSTATDSIIIGSGAGTSGGTVKSVFLGTNAAYNASNANFSVHVGYEAGYGGTNTYETVFVGNSAGYGATGAYYSIFLGSSAGRNASSPHSSNFIGYFAGTFANNAYHSNFFGRDAGGYASNANNSNFFGQLVGTQASNASYSTLIGLQVGRRVFDNGIGRNNIIIGTNITLPNDRVDSINIGGIIFATGSYFAAGTISDDSTYPYSGSVMGRVGINKDYPNTALDISGSLTVTGSIYVQNGITGSLEGTSSWAINAITASYLSGEQAISWVLNSQTSSMTVATASWSTQSISSSYATTASYIDASGVSGLSLNSIQTGSVSASVNTAGTIFVISSASATPFKITDDIVSITGSLNVTGSGITSSLFGTASYALTASYIEPFGTYTTQSFNSSLTWSFTHNLASRFVAIEIYDVNNDIIIPNTIHSVDANTTEIYFNEPESGVALAALAGLGFYKTEGFTNQATWSFNHGLNSKYVAFEIYNSNYDVVIPTRINVVDDNNATIYFNTTVTGTAFATLGMRQGYSVTYATYAQTASYVNTLNQDVNIAGSLTITSASIKNYSLNSSLTGHNLIFNVSTGSNSSAFIRYTIASASNARSGQIMSVWNGGSVTWAETSTTDIGDTSSVTASMAITQSSNVKLEFYTPTNGWNIKTLNDFV